MRRFLIAYGLLASLLGLILRILGARGDLWLDEIHTINLVSAVHSAGQVIWGINHDNNHILNSIYIYWLGPDRSAMALRGLAIVFGTLTVPMAGLAAGGLQRPADAALAMLFFAVSYPLVLYGSEARGYSGLIFFTLMAIWALERGTGTLIGQSRLGIAIFMGILSHFSMIGIGAALFAWRVYLTRQGGLDFLDALLAEMKRFRIALALGLVLFIPILIVIHTHPFIIGGAESSLWQDVTTAYGMLLGAMVGFGQQSLGQTCLLAALATLFLFCWGQRGNRPERAPLYVFAMVILPVVVFATGARNLNNERYYLAIGAIWLLLVVQILAQGLRTSKSAQLLVFAALAGFIIVNTDNLTQFYRGQRGHYSYAVVSMTEYGPATYGTKDTFGIGTVADYYAKRLGRPLTFVKTVDWCVNPPEWLVVRSYPDATPPPRLTRGPDTCPIVFTYDRTFPYWGMSGWQWSTYRRN